MAAPIFKFKNIRVKLNSTNETLIYAVDIGRGLNGLDIGVLPEEVSSVILTVQCANTLGYVQDKEITSFTNTGDWLDVADASDLVPGMAVSFRGISYESIELGRTYYITSVDTSGVNNRFTISESFGGSTFPISGAAITPGDEIYIDIDSGVNVTAKVKDLLTQTDTVLVKDYSIPPSNAFDPLNGNLVLSSKLALYVSANIPGYVEVVVSLLEIANATAT
jgi:hypothetical protein